MGIFVINKKQLAIKAHFFFFMAAMGPILPYLPVYGKQLGVSTTVFGGMTSTLPIFYLIAKPTIGFLVDHYRNWRRTIFVFLIVATNGCFVLLYFLPLSTKTVLVPDEFNATCAELDRCVDRGVGKQHNLTDLCHPDILQSDCAWYCRDDVDPASQPPDFNATIIFARTPSLNNASCSVTNHTIQQVMHCQAHPGQSCVVRCTDTKLDDHCVYGTLIFWTYVLLTSLGCIGYNVTNCISDAICFDVLGEGKQLSYGWQRAWGSLGFGLAAVMAGLAMDYTSANRTITTYTPAFILICAFTLVDLFCCAKLELPTITGTNNIIKDVWSLLGIKPIAIFLFFTAIAGFLDSFFMYFLFWHIENDTRDDHYFKDVKIIEGLIIFAQTLGGEVIFFSLSGKILKKIGYGYSFVLSFACFALRLYFISLMPSPYWIVLIEFFMHGPSFALCYTTIVAYASTVSPPGTSATVQGIVAGMDDGLGFAAGSLICGILMDRIEGTLVMRMFAALAAITAMGYLGLQVTYLKNAMPENEVRNKVQFKSPEEATEMCEINGNNK